MSDLIGVVAFAFALAFVGVFALALVIRDAMNKKGN
jgi:hypothetical protein